MPRIPGIGQKAAVRVLLKVGFVVCRQGKHIIMSRGNVRIPIPRHVEIRATTMGGIATKAGLTPEQFRELL